MSARSVARVAVRLAVLAVALSACGGPASGRVISKGHHDPYTSFITQCLPMGSNPCGSIILLPIDEPECWELRLQDQDDSGSVCVDSQSWARIAVGDHYRAPD